MVIISCSNDSLPLEPLTIAISWNLYDNPCYVHCYSRPLCRKVLKSYRYLAGGKCECECESGMDSEIGWARGQILDLKAELELERKARRKVETANMKLVKELGKERKLREELTRDCSELAKQVEIARSETERLRVEFEDERKMMKMVEILREERVHMKLTEAKLHYEESYNKLFADKQESPENDNVSNRCSLDKLMGRRKISPSPSSGAQKSSGSIAFFASAESENPHIKQGIKGFVEFPKVIRAMGSKNKLLGTRLENQKAQICILLKQKSLMKSSKVVSS